MPSSGSPATTVTLVAAGAGQAKCAQPGVQAVREADFAFAGTVTSVASR